MAGTDSDRIRAQAFTLEAIVASVVILGSLLFALQVSGVTSLTASTSNQHVLDQQGSVAAGVLDAAVANETVRPTLLYWDANESTFHKSGLSDYFYTVGPPTAFGSLLNETLDDRNVAFNVNLYTLDRSGGSNLTRLVRYGQPSDDAARATRTVTLYDDDRLLFANGTVTNTTLANTTQTNATFYASDRYPGGPIYNVVRVEVVVWRV